MRGVPRARRAISSGAVVRQADAEQPGAAPDDRFELVDPVEIEPQRDAEAVAQRRCEQALPRRRADQRERARSMRTDRAAGPSPMMRSRTKSSIAG
jgi:hypothetical protein